MQFAGLPTGTNSLYSGDIFRLTTGSRSVGCLEAWMSCRSTTLSFVWTSNSGPSNWATRNYPTSWAPGTTRFSTRDGREMPGRFSLPSLPLRENGEPRVARTPISSFRLKPFAWRKMGLVSRVSPVQTALRNCTRDEGRSFLRQDKSRKGERECDLKPFIAIQRVQLPPGKGEPASRKRALQGWWQHHS